MCARTLPRTRTSLLNKQASSTIPRPARIIESCNSMAHQSGEEAAIPRRTSIRGRRKLKSALYFALTLIATSTLMFGGPSATVNAFATGNRSGLSQRRSEWIERSVQYYSTVMRKNTGDGGGTSKKQIVKLPKTQMDSTTVPSISEVSLVSSTTSNANNNNDDTQEFIAELDKEFVDLATKHYYARFLIKEGKWSFAEKIYRRIIDELTAEDEDDNCDHTKLAVSTLLLALHLQRTGDVKATRSVFINFFRRVALVHEHENEDEVVNQCSCSAKVLQAYALFEMKNGHSAKSLEIIQRAVKMDEELSPVLGWKQFRDAAAGREYSPTFSFRRERVEEVGAAKRRTVRIVGEHE